MYDWVVLWEWIEIAARWTHVITAIAWIGSSFYFIALDLGLHRDRGLASGADGQVRHLAQPEVERDEVEGRAVHSSQRDAKTCNFSHPVAILNHPRAFV